MAKKPSTENGVETSLTVSARPGRGYDPVSVSFTPGANLDEVSDHYGPEMTYQAVIRELCRGVQELIRTTIATKDKDGNLVLQDFDPADLQYAVDNWAPSYDRTRMSPVEKARLMAGRLSPRERADLVRHLQESA